MVSGLQGPSSDPGAPWTSVLNLTDSGPLLEEGRRSGKQGF